MAGGNLRDGRMEVASELWTERLMPSRLQRNFPPLRGKQYRMSAEMSRIDRVQISDLNKGGTADPMSVLSKTLCLSGADFLISVSFECVRR